MSGFAGLYQVAIQVPATLADGDWPIVTTIGGGAVELRNKQTRAV